MILLTKLNGSLIIINLETVKYIETVPDTLITFLNGDTVMVKEELNKIIDLSVTYKNKIASKAAVSPEESRQV